MITSKKLFIYKFEHFYLFHIVYVLFDYFVCLLPIIAFCSLDKIYYNLFHKVANRHAYYSNILKAK